MTVLEKPAAATGSAGRIAPLDGVRGLAVLAVMAFHTDSRWLASGYLGVDVFFVLSGFLIADILLRAFTRRGRTRKVLTDFWLRRIRRLAPALLVLVAVVSLQRILWPAPGNYGAGPILAALAYVTNWYEIVRGGTYFGQVGQPSPLLHTWSLAIEEQYYLAFPILLVVLLRITKRRRRIALLLLGLAVVSAVWMAYLDARGASELRLYMGTDTRAQALLVGAALGCLVGRARGTLSAWTGDVLGGAGLAVLLVTMLLVQDPARLYAGGFLLQAFASAMLILAALQSGLVSRGLSWRPLVWVGTVSYSVYLWHFPIFAWIQGHDAQAAPVGAQLWSWALTLLVAAFSQRFVERPFLTGPFVARPTAQQWGLYAGAVAVLAATTLVPAGAFGRAPALTWPAEQGLPRQVLVMGDSTAYGLDLFFPQDSLPQMRRAGTYQLGCGFSRLAYRYEERVADVQHCQGWEQRTRDHVALHRPDATVIQSHAWVLFDRSVDGVDHPPGSAVFASDFVDSLRTAVAVGGSDGSVPVFIVKIGCLAPVFHEEILGDPARTRIVNALIDEVAASMPNTHVVESSDVTCRDGRAVERSGSNPRYRDDGMHWTRTGAEVMWNRIAWAMDRARAEGS